MSMEALNTYLTEKTLAEEMNDRLKELKMTITEGALRLECSRSTLSQYLNGKYASDATSIEDRIIAFLEETKPDTAEAGNISGQGFRPVKKIGEKIQYFESRDYIQTIAVCQACQNNAGLGIIVGKSGYGKTHTLKKFAQLPRVIYVEGNETMNCKDIVRRIEGQIGIPRSYGSIDERMERIIDFFNVNEGYLLIVDEADKMINKYTQKKIELLRNISDGAEMGLVIAGEPSLETLLKSYDVRFANRMDFYYKFKGLNQKEVGEYLKGFEVEEAAMSEFLRRANNGQNGCFRLLVRTLNNVIRVLETTGESKVNLRVISEASNMMML